MRLFPQNGPNATVEAHQTQEAPSNDAAGVPACGPNKLELARSSV